MHENAPTTPPIARRAIILFVAAASAAIGCLGVALFVPDLHVGVHIASVGLVMAIALSMLALIACLSARLAAERRARKKADCRMRADLDTALARLAVVERHLKTERLAAQIADHAAIPVARIEDHRRRH